MRPKISNMTFKIFSSRPCVAKFSRKLGRTRKETAEQTALPSHLLSCFLSCAAGFRLFYTFYFEILFRTHKLYQKPNNAISIHIKLVSCQECKMTWAFCLHAREKPIYCLFYCASPQIRDISVKDLIVKLFLSNYFLFIIVKA